MAKERLQEEIKFEIENLDRLNDEMKQLLKRAGDNPTFVEVRAAGSILHDFYSGMEKILERIALSVDKSLPTGEEWHSELLSQMAKPVEGVREEILTDELLQKLKEYLRFRHLFRHIYGFELKWERFKYLCVTMSDVLEGIKESIRNFFTEGWGYRE